MIKIYLRSVSDNNQRIQTKSSQKHMYDSIYVYIKEENICFMSNDKTFTSNDERNVKQKE